MMKNSERKKNHGLLITFLTATAIAFTIVIYISLNIEIERMIKEKTVLEESLIAKKNKTLMLQVEVQKLEAEERITQWAAEKLEMLKFSEPYSVIEIDHNKLEQITKVINSKYE